MAMRIGIVLLSFVSLVSGKSTIPADGGCSLLQLYPFSDENKFSFRGGSRGNDTPVSFSRWTQESIRETGLSFTAAAMLAMKHFNERNPVLVPELSDLSPNCNFRFINQSLVVDSKLNNIAAGEAVLEHAKEFCAILGPYDIDALKWTSTLTASLDVPQLAYSPSLPSFTEPDYFPNTLSVAGSLIAYANRILSFLQEHERTHLAVIHGGSDYDRFFANAMAEPTIDYGINVSLFPMTPPPKGTSAKDHAENLYKQVKLSGIRTIFRVFKSVGPAELLPTARTAMATGLLDDDYIWIIEETMAPVDELASIIGKDTEEGSALDRLLSGAIVIAGSGPSDAFERVWNEQTSTLAGAVNEAVPSSLDKPGYVLANPNYFQTHKPRRYSDFVYDTVMAIGFGGCASQGFPNISSINGSSLSEERDPPPRNDSGPPPNNKGQSSPRPDNGRLLQDGGPPPKPSTLEISNPIVLGAAQTVFTGATGKVQFKEARGVLLKTRETDSVSYGAYNIRGNSFNSTKRVYDVVLVSKTSEDGKWISVPGESIIYRDGTTVQPQPPRVILDENLLPKWASGLGLALMLVAWGFSIFMSFCLWLWREKPLILAGQPLFLQLLCIGSILTSTSILVLSFDEGDEWSDAQLDTACVLTPWFFFVGINTMWAGLFCKLLRIERLATRFRRRQIKTLQALWPLCVLMGLTMACLMAWTLADPWTWQREVISEFPPESYGHCESGNFMAYFAPLCALMIIATVGSAVFAYKTKDLKIGTDNRFDDSKSVFLAIASQLQAWVGTYSTANDTN